MRYCVSDVHGEYELFCRLLKRINFSEKDEMYICGDIIDKGESSVKLAKYIFSFPNIHCIIGNHEYEFIKYYRSLLENSPNDFDSILTKLQEYFPNDGMLLDWDTVDRIESLPYYIEKDDFICAHAGVPTDEGGMLLPLSEANVHQLVYDRRFKDKGFVHHSEKCVFFGHTETSCICGENRIIGYKRNANLTVRSVKDFYKIHLDTGAWSAGVLGCFCIDTLKAVYIKKQI